MERLRELEPKGSFFCIKKNAINVLTKLSIIDIIDT